MPPLKPSDTTMNTNWPMNDKTTSQKPEPPNGDEVELFDRFACFTLADLVRVAGNYAEQIKTLTRERDGARALSDYWKEHSEAHLIECGKERTRAESAEARVRSMEAQLADYGPNTNTLRNITVEQSKEIADLKAINEQLTLQVAHWKQHHGEAEARVKVLEGERDNWKRSHIREVDRSVNLEQRLSAPTWMPVSTPPTEGDGDEKGNVLWKQKSGALMIAPWNTSEKTMDFWGLICWLRVPPLPPATQTEDETRIHLLRQLQKANTGEFGEPQDTNIAGLIEDLIKLETEDAARQSTPKKD